MLSRPPHRASNYDNEIISVGQRHVGRVMPHFAGVPLLRPEVCTLRERFSERYIDFASQSRVPLSIVSGLRYGASNGKPSRLVWRRSPRPPQPNPGMPAKLDCFKPFKFSIVAVRPLRFSEFTRPADIHRKRLTMQLKNVEWATPSPVEGERLPRLAPSCGRHGP